MTRALDKKRNWRVRMLIAGAVIALVCKELPAEYQTVCQLLVNVCNGRF